MRNLKESVFTSLYPLIKEARAQRCFLYHKETKKWYTPDELESLYKDMETHAGQSHKIAEQYAIISPWVGYKQRVETIKNVCDELLRFNEKIFDYFKIPK